LFKVKLKTYLPASMYLDNIIILKPNSNALNIKNPAQNATGFL